MATAGDRIYEWTETRAMPVPAPPRGSCDCHYYTRTREVSPRPNPPYPAIESATFAEAQRMHKAIGFDRGVIVHSAIYAATTACCSRSRKPERSRPAIAAWHVDDRVFGPGA